MTWRHQDFVGWCEPFWLTRGLSRALARLGNLTNGGLPRLALRSGVRVVVLAALLLGVKSWGKEGAPWVRAVTAGLRWCATARVLAY